MILGFKVSCFWANRPDEKPIKINIEMFRLISGKDMKKWNHRLSYLAVGHFAVVRAYPTR